MAVKKLNWDNGDREYEVNGVKFTFCPTDDNILKRLVESRNQLKELADKYGSLERNSKPDSEEELEELRSLKQNVQDEMYAVIDHVVGNKVADKVFQGKSPTATVGGELLILSFIEMIANEVNASSQKEQKLIQKKHKSYLQAAKGIE